ncbi:hypothetical protein ACHAWF_008884 [Thalassiosira exigua]
MPFNTRFVDNTFAIIKAQNFLTRQYKNKINSFGILEWNVDEPSKEVDFLDLTIWIGNGTILTKTHQKPNNLYQYIPPISAHPQG